MLKSRRFMFPKENNCLSNCFNRVCTSFFNSISNTTQISLLQKNASILTVVGKTFDELVLNNPANIVLEVCLASRFKTFFARVIFFFFCTFSLFCL